MVDWGIVFERRRFERVLLRSSVLFEVLASADGGDLVGVDGGTAADGFSCAVATAAAVDPLPSNEVTGSSSRGSDDDETAPAIGLLLIFLLAALFSGAAA